MLAARRYSCRMMMNQSTCPAVPCSSFLFSPRLILSFFVLLSRRNQAGEHKLELFLMCDSYVGCDQEYAVDLMVGAEESDEESS